jgi:hypothetical protein
VRASEMYESRTVAHLVHGKEHRCLSHTLSLSLAHSLCLFFARALSLALLLPLARSRSLSAPAKKWAAPSGYVPGSHTVSRNAAAAYTEVSSQSQVMTLATTKEWQPYGGYEPKRDRSATPAGVAGVAGRTPPSPSSPPSATANRSVSRRPGSIGSMAAIKAKDGAEVKDVLVRAPFQMSYSSEGDLSMLRLVRNQ